MWIPIVIVVVPSLRGPPLVALMLAAGRRHGQLVHDRVEPVVVGRDCEMLLVEIDGHGCARHVGRE